MGEIKLNTESEYDEYPDGEEIEESGVDNLCFGISIF